MASTLRLSARQSSKVGIDTCSRLPSTFTSHNTRTRSGSSYGSGLSSTALTTLKMAALAPMPSVSVRSAISVNDGCRISARRA